ncbi:hypothetical protein THAOC_28076 [Thalassiosira oceanica]|uniref:Uncharacterized protein n=1 Tax=Thalassiosira oceanica TaxID=159749 RepID=K0RHC1_THAOC|nr:hypothetical protein THAOC_28076 [Thalassiosira oceanica]|eukprot:EJK52630.1 hypothetical protein THAOC_28076 [Thalassiosira oceanica]
MVNVSGLGSYRVSHLPDSRDQLPRRDDFVPWVIYAFGGTVTHQADEDKPVKTRLAIGKMRFWWLALSGTMLDLVWGDGDSLPTLDNSILGAESNGRGDGSNLFSEDSPSLDNDVATNSKLVEEPQTINIAESLKQLNSIHHSQLRGGTRLSMNHPEEFVSKSALDFEQLQSVAQGHLELLETAAQHQSNNDKEAVVATLLSAVPDIKALVSAVEEGNDLAPELGIALPPELKQIDGAALALVSGDDLAKSLAGALDIMPPDIFGQIAGNTRDILHVMKEIQTALGPLNQHRHLKKKSNLFDPWLVSGQEKSASANQPTYHSTNQPTNGQGEKKTNGSSKDKQQKQWTGSSDQVPPFDIFELQKRKLKFQPGRILSDNPRVKELISESKKRKFSGLSKTLNQHTHKHKERNRRRLQATDQCRQVDCDPDDYACNCSNLVKCATDISDYDLAVMFGLGFIDSNTDSDGFGTFTESFDTFMANDVLVLKALDINAKAADLASTGDYSNREKCDGLLAEFHSVKTTDEQYQLSIDQVCASVDSAIKLDLNEIKDQYDGLEQIAEGPFAVDGAVDNDSGSNLSDGVYRLRTADTGGDGQVRYMRVLGTVSLPILKNRGLIRDQLIFHLASSNKKHVEMVDKWCSAIMASLTKTLIGSCGGLLQLEIDRSVFCETDSGAGTYSDGEEYCLMRSLSGCNEDTMTLRPNSANNQRYRNELDNLDKVAYVGANCPDYVVGVPEYAAKVGAAFTGNQENNPIRFATGRSAGSEWIPEFQFSINGYTHYISAAMYPYTDCGGDGTHCQLDWIIRPITEIYSGDQAELRDVCRPLILICHEMLKNRLKEHEEIWQSELSPYPGKLNRNLNGWWKMRKLNQSFSDGIESQVVGPEQDPSDHLSSQGVWTITGSEVIPATGLNDHFNYIFVQVGGDVDVRLRVHDFDSMNAAAMAGLMARDSLDTNARQYTSLVEGVSGDQRGRMTMRFTPGDHAQTHSLQPILSENFWLHMVRQGNTFHAYYSDDDGLTWPRIGEARGVGTWANQYIGIAVSSGASGEYATLRASDFSINGEVYDTVVQCQSTSYNTCADFSRAFDLLYQGRNATLYPDNNPMIDENGPGIESQNTVDTLLSINLPNGYKFDQSNQGVTSFDGYEYASFDSFPGEVEDNEGTWYLELEDNMNWMACAGGANCREEEAVQISSTELHPFVCCADAMPDLPASVGPGWRPPHSSQADICPNAFQKGTIATDPLCEHRTFSEAVQACSTIGGRLCTVNELEAGCASSGSGFTGSGPGCGDHGSMSWSTVFAYQYHVVTGCLSSQNNLDVATSAMEYVPDVVLDDGSVHTMECQNRAPWHTGISAEACDNVLGTWFRSPCITLKECIDDRVTDPEHEGYSRSFEEFVSGTPEDPLTKRIRVWHDHYSNLIIEEIQVLDGEGINHSLESSTSQSSISGDKSALNAIDGSFASHAETEFEKGMCIWSSGSAVVTLPDPLFVVVIKEPWLEVVLDESTVVKEMILHGSGLDNIHITFFDSSDTVVGRYQVGDLSGHNGPEIRIHGDDFENPNQIFIGGFVIEDETDEAQCEHAREEDDFEVCAQFKALMCGEDAFFDAVDEMVEEADQPRTTSHVQYSQRTFAAPDNLEFIELTNKEEFLLSKGVTKATLGFAKDLTKDAKDLLKDQNSFEYCSKLLDPLLNVPFLGDFLYLAGLLVCLTVYLLIWVLLHLSKYTAMIAYHMNSILIESLLVSIDKTDFAKAQYFDQFYRDEWLTTSLSDINTNIGLQHTTLRDQNLEGQFHVLKSALNSLDLTRNPNGDTAKEILVEDDPSCRCVLYPDDSDPRWAGTCETEFSFSNRRLLEELSIKTASEMQPGIMMPAGKLNEIIKKEDEIIKKEDEIIKNDDWMMKELAIVREDGDDLITAVNDIRTALGVRASGAKSQRSKAAKITKGELVAEKDTSLVPKEVSTGEENVLDKLQNKMGAIERDVQAVKENMHTNGRKMDTIEHMLVQLISQNDN